MAEPVVNGLDEMEIKTEPTDPLLDINDPPVIPKEYVVSNGLHEDSDCDDITYFTQVEVDNTRKCLENTRLIIKDFETQLDWHLQQYMALRNVVHPKKNGGKDDTSKRQDLLSISQLSALIANHPEGNKKFIKRKGPISNGAGGRRRRKNKDESEEEETDFSDEDSEDFDEEDFEMGDDSEGVDDPGEAKKPKRAKAKKLKTQIQVKDEIEEEEHELIEPKIERESDEEIMEEAMMMEPEPAKKTPAKRGRKPKGEETKITPKKGARGKKGQKNMETVDLTNLKTCKVVLNRVEGEDEVEVKDENIDKDELVELLKRKAITLLSEFAVDSDKPIVILKEDNVKEFDFNECKTSNVVVTFEDSESFPEFIFVKDVVENILNGSIKLVQGSVFDEHLSDEKN